LHITQKQRGLYTFLKDQNLEPKDGLRNHVVDGTLLCDYLQSLLGNIKFDFDGSTEPSGSDVHTTRVAAFIESPDREVVTLTLFDRGFTSVGNSITFLEKAGLLTLE
jgi:hypothetical protein